MYFSDDEQDKILGKFASMLRPGGHLVTGYHDKPILDLAAGRKLFQMVGSAAKSKSVTYVKL